MCMDNSSYKHTLSTRIYFKSRLFSLYMLPLAKVNKKQDISVHGYVDDTQLYIPLCPDDPQSIDALFRCISDLSH